MKIAKTDGHVEVKVESESGPPVMIRRKIVAGTPVPEWLAQADGVEVEVDEVVKPSGYLKSGKPAQLRDRSKKHKAPDMANPVEESVPEGSPAAVDGTVEAETNVEDDELAD
jgi:hypothetical protein